MYELHLLFVAGDQINNIWALVHIMAWCQPGNKPLSEPMMVRFLMHIYITEPQWIEENLSSRFLWLSMFLYTETLITIETWMLIEPQKHVSAVQSAWVSLLTRVSVRWCWRTRRPCLSGNATGLPGCGCCHPGSQNCCSHWNTRKHFSLILFF